MRNSVNCCTRNWNLPKVPQKQPKRKRLWLNDSSCIRLRPRYKNHVWSYDFVMARTPNGKAIRMLTIIDEYIRECLAIEVNRKLNSQNVMHVLSQLFIDHGTPQYIRSDNGPEFLTKRFRWWLKRHITSILEICLLFKYIIFFSSFINNRESSGF